LHLPGLEAYAHVDSPAPVAAAINPANTDGLAVDVHSGIEQEQRDLSAWAAVFFLLAYLVSTRPQPQHPAIPYGPPPPHLLLG